MQTLIFHPATKGAWILRFDDILADAAEFGELRNNEMDLPPKVYADFRAVTPETVPDYVIEMLVKYYIVNKSDDSVWVVLPVTNFDAYFETQTSVRSGSTFFQRNILRSKRRAGFAGIG